MNEKHFNLMVETVTTGFGLLAGFFERDDDISQIMFASLRVDIRVFERKHVGWGVYS